MRFTYPAIFYEGEGGFTVEVPDLPGCVSGGDTLAEAILMGTDAASGWVLTELEDIKNDVSLCFVIFQDNSKYAIPLEIPRIIVIK
ncbi:MAG: type II toxin-antitoxin system HicB family antitoxin [Treponema sp.]|jgi:predicted RNase H-like HicB family nuclease|nr:type II toxin-antitoxin system HicB family antitoxin [Treponema sp.]